jgi:hypothetical protein
MVGVRYMSLEIHKTLVLSTAHMTEADSNLLPYADECGLVVYELDEYGWMIYVNDEYLRNESTPLSLSELSDFSDGFKQAIKLAQDNDCEWLRFDRDANTVDELPEYEW